MATMNRNLNLEEVNSDAFMGIPYLNHQTVWQKAVLILSIIAAAAVMMVGTFVFHWNSNISIILAFVPLLFGAAFGCNYNQDLSLIKFVRLMLFKPSKTYTAKSTEDVQYLHSIEAQIKQEEALKARQQEKSSSEEQMKVLIVLAIAVICIIAVFVLIFIIIKSTRVEEIHHTVSLVVEGLGGLRE